MTRGKYAAKAANRMAQLDNEIIADLRAKLAALTAERDEVRQEAARLRDKLASEVNRAAEHLSAARINEVAQELVAERQARKDDQAEYAREVFRVITQHGGRLPAAGHAALASVFGQSHRLGELVDETRRATALPATRNGRRATAKSARIRGDMSQVPSWLHAPVK